MFNKIISAVKWRVKDYRPYIFRPRKMVFLFGSPGHKNMGDQAQTYCIQKWLRENYPEYGIRIFTLKQSTEKVFVVLRKFIRKNDILICHSGYHITDLYNERLPYMELAKRFKDHRIIVFPQTVFFNDSEKLIENADVFNRHGNLLLMCRDKVSFDTATHYFTNCRLMLMPDIVTSLIGTFHFKYHREGVLFCMRNDKEAYYKPSEINILRKRFSECKTDITDTTLNLDVNYIIENREKILKEIFDEYAHYQVVITDRYHGTIFSLIAGTPVVVIGSTDHKLSSGVKWFPNDFADYVCFANNLEEAYAKASSILKDNKARKTLPPYFKEKYYDNLKREIENKFAQTM